LAVSSAEDPEKILDQTVLEMQEVGTLRSGTFDV
jgi:phage shock protein A